MLYRVLERAKRLPEPNVRNALGKTANTKKRSSCNQPRGTFDGKIYCCMHVGGARIHRRTCIKKYQTYIIHTCIHTYYTHTHLQRERLALCALVEVLLAVRSDLQDAPSLDDGGDEMPVLFVQVHTPQEGLVLLLHPPSSVVAAPIVRQEVASVYIGGVCTQVGQIGGGGIAASGAANERQRGGDGVIGYWEIWSQRAQRVHALKELVRERAACV